MKKTSSIFPFVLRDAQTKQELEFRVERLIEKKKFRRDNFLLEFLYRERDIEFCAVRSRKILRYVYLL